jgi:hypothetical protein
VNTSVVEASALMEEKDWLALKSIGDFNAFRFWESDYWSTDVPIDQTYQPVAR